MSKNRSKKKSSPLWLIPVFVFIGILILYTLSLSTSKETEYDLPERLSVQYGQVLPEPNWSGEQGLHFKPTNCGYLDVDLNDVRLEIDIDLLLFLVDQHCAGPIRTYTALHIDSIGQSVIHSDTYPGYEFSNQPLGGDFLSGVTATGGSVGQIWEDVNVAIPTGYYTQGDSLSYTSSVGAETLFLTGEEIIQQNIIHELLVHGLARSAVIPKYPEEELEAQFFERELYDFLESEERELIRFK